MREYSRSKLLDKGSMVAKGRIEKPNGRTYCKEAFISSLCAGSLLCAAVAGHTRPARSFGVGDRLGGQLRGAGDKRQESHYAGGSDGKERYAQRALQQQSS
jgi:hypothetical protein